MSHEVRLSRVDRRYAILNIYPMPRVRVSVSPRSTHAERAGAAQSNEPDGVDDLSAARGILFALLLGIALWGVLGIVIWFIAR